jgi:DivIVA domain-containing protein
LEVRVALERQSIEKKDFPIGRRGYDPDAVDTHLSAVADEVEELKRSSRRRSETLASTASEQVRAIVEAAEQSAADIQRQAEEEAQEIRAEASAEAQSARENATDQAREYVGRVSESTAVMLQRLDAMESELSALIESLRTGSNRLNADLQLLEGNLTDVREATAPRPRFEPEAPPEPVAPPPPPPPEPEPEPVAPEPEAVAPEPEPMYEPPPREEEPVGSYAVEEVAEEEEEEEKYTPPPVVEEPEEKDTYVEDMQPEPYEAEPAGAEGSDDTEGARLIALNMALNGTPREETDRYLAENFQLADRSGLLDEVYSSVEG